MMLALLLVLRLASVLMPLPAPPSPPAMSPYAQGS